MSSGDTSFMTIALITGINGFVGHHLATLLAEQGRHVAGIGVEQTCPIPDAQYEMIDITDSNGVARAFERLHPQEIYHLAGVSFPVEMDRTPRSALEINITGSVSVLDAMRRYCPSAKLLMIGSSKEYDITAKGPVTEDITPAPANFYGISKYAGELIGLQYCRRYGLDIRFTRSFNHTGPGQSHLFVCSDWARQIAMAECERGPAEVRVGDSGEEIDFSDVRDVARAYFLIMEKGIPGQVYNVCSGTTQKLLDVLDYLVRKSTKKIQVITEEKKLRKGKKHRIFAGDNTKLCRETGWAPEVPFEKTLDDLFDYWVRNLQALAPDATA
jgi:GDP-4-dehydro-6-deoxy-D-mannose reductase